MYEQLLANLRHEIEFGQAHSKKIDISIEKLMLTKDARLTGDLLLLLSDQADDDVGMFSLIHAAEAAPDSLFVTALLMAFPNFSHKSPRWASIVLIRVLNNPSARLEFEKQLRESPVAVRGSVKAMCQIIGDKKPNSLRAEIGNLLAVLN